MTSLSAFSLNGSSIEVDLSDVENVWMVRHRIAIKLVKPVSKVKLVVGDRMISDADELDDLGSAFLVLIEGNLYLHEGKKVTQFVGTMADGGRCVVYYADGSTRKGYGYNAFDSLIKDFGFAKYTSYGHDPKSHVIYERFEAVPPGDAGEWEEFEQCFDHLGENQASGISAWRRKGQTLAAGAFLTEG